MFISTEGGSELPLKETPLEYDVICTPPSFHSSMFISNTELYNYRVSYIGLD